MSFEMDTDWQSNRTVYTWRKMGLEHFLEVTTGEGGRLESWRFWASLGPGW